VVLRRQEAELNEGLRQLLSDFVVTSIRETTASRAQLRRTSNTWDAGDSLILLGSSCAILPRGQACSLHAEVSAGTKDDGV
jgi:hypothetical protein